MKLKQFLQQETVLTAAAVLAVVSAFFVPPDVQYIGYIDLRTLAILFSLMTVMAGLRRQGFFDGLGRTLLSRTHSTFQLTMVLVGLCFFGSMFITNDVSLLTFVPFTFVVLNRLGADVRRALLIPVVCMQTIAANLGSMLTPIGNPQNLYLYTKYEIPNMEFMRIMAPPFVLSITLLTLCCIVFTKQEALAIADEPLHLNKRRTAIYLVLFTLSIVMVFRIIPYWIGLIVIFAALLILDPKALKMVDYPLLFTFVFFFVFAGNMARIDAIRTFFCALLEKNTLVFSVISCQFISNVPSAILLSQFTENYPDLLVGVNIGGVGTLIASLASLITFREYVKNNPGRSGYYIKQFSLFNFSFLIVLVIFMSFWTRS